MCHSDRARFFIQIDGNDEVPVTWSPSHSTRSNSSSLDVMLDKLRQKTPSTAPFLTSVSPSPGSKVDGNDQLMTKISHDENLITTQDIEVLEESFKKNTPTMGQSSSGRTHVKPELSHFRQETIPF